MPPKKRLSKSKVNIQKSNVQTVVVKVGEQPKKKRVRRRKQTSRGGEGVEMPFRQLPPVVYQIPSMSTGYTSPLFEPARIPQSIAVKESPKPASQPILEDIGIVGTEGRGVEIIDVPSKKEQLSELTTPVDLQNETPIMKQSFGKANVLQSVKEKEFLPQVSPVPESPMQLNVKEDIPVQEKTKMKRKSKREIREDREQDYYMLVGKLPPADMTNAVLIQSIKEAKASLRGAGFKKKIPK
jgi:hypothetical protein